MTRIEYDLLQQDHPELKLPLWYKLMPSEQREMLKYPAVEVMAWRFRALILEILPGFMDDPAVKHSRLFYDR